MKIVYYLLTILLLANCSNTPIKKMPKECLNGFKLDGYSEFSLERLIRDESPQKPIYPRMAIKEKVQGCAFLTFDIDAEGVAQNIKIYKSIPEGYQFGQFAAAYILKSKFKDKNKNKNYLLLNFGIKN